MQTTTGNHLAFKSISRSILGMAAAVCLLTASAKFQVPFWPVPMTLQLMVVLGLAVFTGPKQAFACVAAYLAAGAVGLPVFAGTPLKGIGLAYMVGPTGGYLLGFLVSTLVCGKMLERLGSKALIPALLAGMATIFAFGLAWLAFYVPAEKVLAIGLTPFLLGDIVELALIVAAYYAMPEKWKNMLRPSIKGEAND
ncbi:biotin transporter BioY [Polycladidibacter stylochi]|uniref:biotin transporter BioY n=1 Tax=Polycladidibacter stylochi TaxID=1807766 RepID=UPI0009EA1C82|nr:biotin transporter BioY [Pseudovibrio stylochi]